MPSKIGFDNERYLSEQTAAIRERVTRFGNKLYLEFGGKIMFDYHAARVLPGYDPNVKVRLLRQLRDQTDIILCIHAGASERKKMRADFGITYDADAHYHHLLDDIIEGGKMQPTDGCYAVPNGPGLGVTLDEDRMAKYVALFEKEGDYYARFHEDVRQPGWFPINPGW